MNSRACSYGLFPVLMAGMVAASCASAPKPAVARVTVAASPDSNPDATGRPSPVVVRVYQLKGDATFNEADFFALYDDEQKVLGADLITRAEYIIEPSEKRSIELSVSPEARFVGAIAAFRDIRTAQWRAIVAVGEDRDSVAVGVERARIVMSVED
jgi:type VI secretion system protein VasD